MPPSLLAQVMRGLFAASTGRIDDRWQRFMQVRSNEGKRTGSAEQQGRNGERGGLGRTVFLTVSVPVAAWLDCAHGRVVSCALHLTNTPAATPTLHILSPTSSPHPSLLQFQIARAPQAFADARSNLRPASCKPGSSPLALSLLQFQIERARQIFADAEAGVNLLDKDARWPVW